ncbi:hydroxysqualene dehydroxylase [Salinilacihabitans rarus]|uniref:hydroxysqualene dehydroxylase n=1 Tax=Salinilacihabitans rarus TaxID=2961596 RepID=UPI0020C83CF7|nr:FAD-dependent oxidoreductase [Salinilacihabitans rarus]
MTRVTILGGGVAGLTAAHELAERGFDVTVYERNPRFGGKARSLPGPRLDGGAALPAEHGFRFFPGFYRHVIDTMERTPLADDSGRTVADNLVRTTQMLQAVTTGDSRVMVTDRPRSLAGWRERLGSIFGGAQVPPDESAFFVDRLLTLLTSCEARFDEEYERLPWWEFVNAAEMSDTYRKFLAYGVTQSLVAMRPEVASTRTIGRIYLQMLRGLFDDSVHADRLLNGPTNDAWIDPWVAHVERLGATLHANATVTAVEFDEREGRVSGVRVERGGREERVESDYYVLAVPVEAARRLVTPEIAATAPSLADLDRIDTAWMNGVQFYLAEDVPTVEGHGVYYDSPWALTSISQRQFWEEFDRYDGDGAVGGVLSVIISEWDRPGIVYEKPARECTREELAAEVWAQLKAHLDGGPADAALADENLLEWFVDPALAYDEAAGRLTNREPLLVNTVGTLQYRPPADVAVPNLAVAADYVHTHTDLASMEAASEAARRAVTAILEREGHPSAAPGLWEFDLPRAFEPARRQDALHWRLGLPHPGAAAPALWRGYRRATEGPRTGFATVARVLGLRE